MDRVFSIPKEKVDSLVIRSFKAPEDPISSKAFKEGHAAVIESFGFVLSSVSQPWETHQNTYVIIVESEDGSKVYGGARIQIYDKQLDLPVIGAIDEEAPEIVPYVEAQTPYKFAELCGLWNSISAAGLGIGSVFAVRAAVALAGMVGVEKMIALCSVHTFRIAHRYGFGLVSSVGNNGAINYAGAKQIAKLTEQSDIWNLPNSNEIEKEIILSMRNNPSQVIIDRTRGEQVSIRIDLKV
ncbi:MAG: hypothetical protein ACK5W1_05895 [Flavobacteriales bacterium]